MRPLHGNLRNRNLSFMKYIVLLSLMFLFSCSVKVIPLKGNYPKPPFQKETNISPEKVWDRIIDLFAQKGYSIQIIDHSSGLITSKQVKLRWSYENKYGKLDLPDAIVAIQKVVDKSGHAFNPSQVLGEWNIRIKPTPSGGTLININLVNLQYSPPLTSYNGNNNVPLFFKEGHCVSTGNFEQQVFEMITK
jgi:hypothetical protein